MPNNLDEDDVSTEKARKEDVKLTKGVTMYARPTPMIKSTNIEK